jgi:hypothetical protein
MRALLKMSLAAVLIVGLTDTVTADANLSRFFGSYSGYGYAEDSKGVFMNTPRDFNLDIRPLGTDGFEVSWLSVKRKGSDPNSLETVTSRHTSSFRPSGKPGVYHDIDNGALMKGHLVSWARLQGDYLIVYRIVIEESGVPEFHIYQRMLTAQGLDLLFTASRDGRTVRTVRGRYQRQ